MSATGNYATPTVNITASANAAILSYIGYTSGVHQHVSVGLHRRADRKRLDPVGSPVRRGRRCIWRSRARQPRPSLHGHRDNGTEDFAYNKGELQYNYLIFENGGVPTVEGAAPPPPPSPPGAPTGMAATRGNTIVTVSWTPATGATSHKLYWDTAPNVTVADSIITGATSPYTHSGRTNGTRYYYRATASRPAP